MPHVNVNRARETFDLLHQAITKGYIRACHDLSEGGLAVAAAEMAFAGGWGMDLDVARCWTPGGFAERSRASFLRNAQPVSRGSARRSPARVLKRCCKGSSRRLGRVTQVAESRDQNSSNRRKCLSANRSTRLHKAWETDNRERESRYSPDRRNQLRSGNRGGAETGRRGTGGHSISTSSSRGKRMPG